MRTMALGYWKSVSGENHGHDSRPGDVWVDTSESVCAEADRLVSTVRNQDYGHPLEDYTRTANIFNAVTGHKITALDAIKFMVCVKLSREQHKHKRDNLVDACGYIKCLDWSITEQENRNENTRKP